MLAKGQFDGWKKKKGPTPHFFAHTAYRYKEDFPPDNKYPKTESLLPLCIRPVLSPHGHRLIPQLLKEVYSHAVVSPGLLIL